MTITYNSQKFDAVIKAYVGEKSKYAEFTVLEEDVLEMFLYYFLEYSQDGEFAENHKSLGLCRYFTETFITQMDPNATDVSSQMGYPLIDAGGWVITVYGLIEALRQYSAMKTQWSSPLKFAYLCDDEGYTPLRLAFCEDVVKFLEIKAD